MNLFKENMGDGWTVLNFMLKREREKNHKVNLLGIEQSKENA